MGFWKHFHGWKIIIFPMIFGFVLFFGTLGGTAGPLLSGRIFDVTGSYDIAFVAMIGFAMFGLLLSLALRRVKLADE